MARTRRNQAEEYSEYPGLADDTVSEYHEEEVESHDELMNDAEEIHAPLDDKILPDFDTIVRRITTDAANAINQFTSSLKEKALQENISHPIDTVNYGEIVEAIKTFINRKTTESFDIQERNYDEVIIPQQQIIHTIINQKLPSNEDSPSAWICLIDPNTFGLEYILKRTENGNDLRYLTIEKNGWQTLWKS